MVGKGPNRNGGFCECGCGKQTRIAAKTHLQYGHVKGQPVRFLKGHNRDNRRTIVARFGSDYEVRESGYTTPCWLWRGALDTNGYSICNRRDWSPHAHQHYYETLYGPVADGLELDHLCRNRNCVNPEHLEAVSHALNMQRGMRARFEAWQVRAIRRAYEECEFTIAHLARTFRVGESTIRHIVKRNSWRNV